ncbi:UDP-glucose dehydrogenase family protein [Metabacillus arenae]|uniref:UDP-glucose 6-dehydrogenase n=1 Tax=Metabacillus arenae TaxID=2771434 RepID=A0A926NR33_9BACI|nr:UDP-glucose/GDP-mannose dehydrogenase family protein [Metabacillus arenae]MBD1382452.1 UDP-glucose/GDP-mannose dehydrogenase family protein [Metabacillus arenae]
MKIAVIGTGYVGLVTGVCLAEVGHHVTCIDINEEKVEKLRKGIPPIYEKGLDVLMIDNIDRNRLKFTTVHKEGLSDAEVVYIAVGTPQSADGSADLTYIYQAAKDIGEHVNRDVLVVTKSTVPLGTNFQVKEIVEDHVKGPFKVEVASNPEFLREGSAVYDTFNGDRIVIGTETEEAAAILEKINEPFDIPVLKTSITSAEMIKYASNAFLATKISFINEIASLSEKVGADISDVAKGVGQDHRIGSQFLNAGIGYGGSCFPKDTQALVRISEEVEHDFKLLKSVIDVNARQKTTLFEKAKKRFGTLKGMRVALLGLAFKPETDDMREAASIEMANALTAEGAEVIAYDPIAMENAKKVLPESVQYAENIENAIKDATVVFILTDWKEIKEKALLFSSLFMKKPIIFDGRNCYSQEETEKVQVEYYSVGRSAVNERAIHDSNKQLAASF